MSNLFERVLLKTFKILGIHKRISDTLYLKLFFKVMMNQKLDLENPRTFNEKLQWLKLYDHNPEYTIMVDKYAVKDYVADKIGKEYIIPTLGVWDSFDYIDFDELPDRFVLKCTHDSGGLVICNDKKTLDLANARNKLEQSMKRNYYWNGREWPYKNVRPRILAEQYMGNGSSDHLKDYKLFCFGGVPRMTLVCSERFSKDGLREDFFDENWNHLPIKRKTHENSILSIECPEQYELMKQLAAKISDKMIFTRIDFYEISNKVYFGEITFYPACGFEGFEPDEWDLKLGQWIKIPGMI